MKFKALCIGDILEPVRACFDDGESITYAQGAYEALDLLRAERFDAMFARLPVPGCPSGETLIEEARRIRRGLRAVFCDCGNVTERAVRLVQAGAFDVVVEEHLREAVQRASEKANCQSESSNIAAQPWRKLLIGQSAAMMDVADMVHLVADRRSTVLITGETGTGKEVVARAIHQAGKRSQYPMVSVNCSALPDALLEAELFGHVRGAFTGAFVHRVGRFEQAHRGTLFLDEIGDMAPSLQAKLLRVLQEREFQRLGSSDNIRVDVRVIAATNVDLGERLRQGKFREDLFYRLNVVPIQIPPLRERPNDIPLLAGHFIERICRDEGIAPKELAAGLLEKLSRHDWPGNVRQLENAIEMAIALSGDRVLLLPSDFALPSRITVPRQAESPPFVAVPDQGLDFEQTVGSIERDILEQALSKTNGNKKAAAQMLRLKRTTLAAKLKTLSAAAVGV